MNVILQPHHVNESIPYNLLLLADPDLQKVKTYVNQNQLYLARNEENELVGVCVVQVDVSAQSWEILNIAVSENFHNQGVGQQIIAQIVTQAKAQQVPKLWVATANSSIGQLAFYQKCGFEMHTIVHNYFIKNYPEPIIENGIVAKHQIRLMMKI